VVTAIVHNERQGTRCGMRVIDMSDILPLSFARRSLLAAISGSA